MARPVVEAPDIRVVEVGDLTKGKRREVGVEKEREGEESEKRERAMPFLGVVERRERKTASRPASFSKANSLFSAQKHSTGRFWVPLLRITPKTNKREAKRGVVKHVF